MITNPIVPGFTPDPSILRVGDDYYLATSTFQWVPGVTIWHSRDLAHWRCLGGVLTRKSLADLSGVGDSCGVYAPQISFKDGTFYLVYTIVRGNHWPYVDAHNYLISTHDVCGAWSEPTYLQSWGIDPSLFHDDDGRSYLLTNEIDFRPSIKNAVGIRMQEYRRDRRALVGETRLVYPRAAEGPHLYKRGGWYYLCVAVGGTDYNHAAEIARSKAVFGPYERDPDAPLLTSFDHPDLPLQKAGHACLVQTGADEWFMTHLVGRPLPGTRKCMLGRETALQRIVWSADGWPRLAHGTRYPQEHLEGPAVTAAPFTAAPARDDFDGGALAPEYLTLRDHADETWLSFRRRPSCLSLRGRESYASTFAQSVVARRIRSFAFSAETVVDFAADNYRRFAGLSAYYDCRDFFLLALTHDERIGRCVVLIHGNGKGWDVKHEAGPIAVGDGRCRMRLECSDNGIQFWFGGLDEPLRKIGPVLDAAELSDEQNDKYGFTGALIGLHAVDMLDGSTWAHFEYLYYRDS